MKFGKLTFLKELEPKIRTNGNKRRFALFLCDCGNQQRIDFFSVKTGKKEQCNDCGFKKRKEKKTTHGKSNTTLYRRWADMKKRCYNPNVDRYNQYGALGIKVCDEWKNSFQSFLDWSLKNGYEKELSLERKNVNGDYEPSNCIYISLREQHFNKKNTRYVLYENKKIALSKLLYDNNLSDKLSSIHSRLNRGQKIEDILTFYKTKELNGKA
jgi:hypothetical protein